MSFASYPNDTVTLDLLELVSEPSPVDLTNLAALSMRYSGDTEMHSRITDKSMEWGYSLDQLFVKCREIWLSGFHSTKTITQGGSGHDTTATT